MKPTKDFKMTKRNKTLIALGKFKDEHARGAFKRAMIDAQLSAEKADLDNKRGKAGKNENV